MFCLDDGFRITLGQPLPVQATQEPAEETTQDTEYASRGPSRPRERILALMQQQPTITTRERAEALALSFDWISYHRKTLRAEGRVRHEGPNKAKRWVVIPPTQLETS